MKTSTSEHETQSTNAQVVRSEKETRPPYVERHQELWRAFRAAQTVENRNALVEAYHSYAQEITRRFAMRLPRSVDRGDLDIAAGVGLMSAVSGFDPERGVRFESYCELRVRGAILDELRTQDWLPRPWRQRLETQKRAVERLRGDLEREPSDEEVAQLMGLEIDLYLQVFGTGLPGTPAGSMPTDDGGEDSTFGLEVVPDRSSDKPGDRLGRDEILSLATASLSEQEYRVLYLRYWEGLPMKEIGELTDLSESRVCKIHTRLLERLKDRLRVSQPED